MHPLENENAPVVFLSEPWNQRDRKCKSMGPFYHPRVNLMFARTRATVYRRRIRHELKGDFIGMRRQALILKRDQLSMPGVQAFILPAIDN